jgi:alpha-1,6-mannosyltransferase
MGRCGREEIALGMSLKNITFPHCGVRVIFLDINTFYGPKAGGIRTYQEAKLDWFSRQNEHVYCLIYPGPVYRVERPSPSVYRIQVYGPPLTSDREGYRLLIDYVRVLKWIRRLRPEVIEAGDAWVTSWFCLGMRASRLWDGLLVSFYHSDPITSYLVPWSQRGNLRGVRRVLTRAASALFYAVQRRFDWTATASRVMEQSLHQHGVERVRRLPFGVRSALFQSTPWSRQQKVPGDPVHLLYAGRLDRDKGIELLLEVLPVLLREPSFRITVAGRGGYTNRFESVQHPHFQFVGFLDSEESLVALYNSSDVFLAPGAHETFGLAVLEAMAAGLTVVGPAAAGTGELLVEIGSPFAFSPGSAESFLEKIRAAAACDLPDWSARHREIALRYGTWDDAVRRMVSTWQGLA